MVIKQDIRSVQTDIIQRPVTGHDAPQLLRQAGRRLCAKPAVSIG